MPSYSVPISQRVANSGYWLLAPTSASIPSTVKDHWLLATRPSPQHPFPSPQQVGDSLVIETLGIFRFHRLNGSETRNKNPALPVRLNEVQNIPQPPKDWLCPALYSDLPVPLQKEQTVVPRPLQAGHTSPLLRYPLTQSAQSV
jgi:hypothetical protein